MSIDNATPKEWDSLNQVAKDFNIGTLTGRYTTKDEYSKASSKQVGGTHYKGFEIQPAEFCYKNNIPYLEATAIKYLCRWREKGGVQDLDKAIHFIEMLKEFYNGD
jgi:hypothetical protein